MFGRHKDGKVYLACHLAVGQSEFEISKISNQSETRKYDPINLQGGYNYNIVTGYVKRFSNQK